MIPAIQARGILTKAYTAKYMDDAPAPSFFKSFFPTKTYNSATINLEVRRGTEKIAADVLRGTRGNRNTFSRSTEKEFLPPFYKEFFDVTELRNYDRMWGASDEQVNASIIGQMADDVAEKYIQMRNKIERAKELQAAKVLETGIVPLVNGDNIDFKRKSASLVDLTAAGYWSNASAPIEAQLIAGQQFIRREGKNGSVMLDLITSQTGWTNLQKTTFFKEKANFTQVNLLNVNMPRKEAYNAAMVGQITAGGYTYNVWVYDEAYQDENGDYQTYWPENKAVILPSTGLRFEFSHAAVPAIIRDTRNAEFSEFIGRISAEYYRTNIIDKNAMAHYFWIMSAGVAIPVSVDMIYTMQIAGDSQIIGG